MLNLVELVGMIAATLTTIAFIPQAVRTIKTKQTRDISLITYILFSTGIFMWFIYGLFIHKTPIILANGLTLLLIIPIIILKLIYK